MTGAIVTFRLGRAFDEKSIRKIAEGARPMFERMPGLRSKAFTFDAMKGEAINFYVWDDESAAKAFFNEQLLERVTGLYGVRPEITFVQIVTLIDNART